MFEGNTRGVARLACALALLFCANALTGRSITSVYVQAFTKKGADPLREEVIKALKGQKDVTIVDSEAAADRVLTGTNQTYIKGYLSRNPRVRYRNSDSRPVYAGYVSLELKNKQDDTLWSYLVTPGRFGDDDINRNLANQIAAKLLQFLEDPSNNP